MWVYREVVVAGDLAVWKDENGQDQEAQLGSLRLGQSTSFTTPSLQVVLDRFGSDNWELVSTSDIHVDGGQRTRRILYFKRLVIG